MLSRLGYNPDVLSCLANLSSDEIFTPPGIANKLLDGLPVDIWSNSKVTFLDPSAKSGIFLREIARRLDLGLIKEFPDRQTRINHIFNNQIFAIAITELTGQTSRRSLYGTKTANGKYSFCDNFKTEFGNIWYEPSEHKWVGSYCAHCGANKLTYEVAEDQEKYAYGFIHQIKPEELFNMRFDVIVGNPPYHLDTGGSGRQAKPIYQLFVQQAIKLNPRYLSMIIPSRWFAGGMGLDSFRGEMLKDRHISKLVDFVDAADCFPDVDIPGGVCYFLWDREYDGDCEVTNVFNGNEYKSKRSLGEFDTFVRLSPSVPILSKVLDRKEVSLAEIVSATRPFGLQTKDRPDGTGNIRLVSSGGDGKIKLARVTSGHGLVKKWKVLTSKTSHDHAGNPDKDGMRRVLSRVEILEPNAVCTESYIVIGAFDTEVEAINCMNYLKTMFVRHLISILSFSQDITRERFRYVPIQDFTKNWTDTALNKKYTLTKDEIQFIESVIRPMDI